ncbi:Nuclear transport factor [Giardia duodenalis]|uniref:Nuclear transport factor n=1 Tax=Giardia intestinalis TaxID=5741 RepID=V6TMT6_GIAIN|nr:Nuclear transport factor [Giardia intestinalis]
MANSVFIASATGSGKMLSIILPLALEAFAGLDFVALFVVPTAHLLAQTHRLLLRLFHDVPFVQVLQAIDCLSATLYEDPALL